MRLCPLAIVADVAPRSLPFPRGVDLDRDAALLLFIGSAVALVLVGLWFARRRRPRD